MNFIEETLRALELRQARITCAIAALQALDPREWEGLSAGGREATGARPVQPRAAKKPAGAPAPKVKTEQPKSTARPILPPVSRGPTPGAQAAILGVLAAAGRPLSKSEIIDRAKLTAFQVKHTTGVLLDIQKVVLTGHGRAAKWSLAQTTLPKSSDPELESVWNGTKERAGQAPGLSSVGRC